MPVSVHLLPTPAGLALAAVSVALGAPLFSEGLRATRLRRRLGTLRRVPLDEGTHGFVHVSGRVELESPLFGPLSSQPCAGFRLHIEAESRPIHRHVEVRRGFRIREGAVAARVPAGAGRWSCAATASRRVAPGDALSQNLAALLARVPEAGWLRRTGVTLLLTEHALLSGAECHVVGVARAATAVFEAEEIELGRTGTDDIVVMASAGHPGAAAAAGPWNRSGSDAAEIAFPGGENHEFFLVADREPRPDELHVSSLRGLGVVFGPLLTLAGLFYLAALADALRSGARMVSP